MTKKSNSSETTNKKRGLIRLTFYSLTIIINMIVAICTLLGKTACFVNPTEYVLPSYLGLVFPYLVMANVALIIFWGIKRNFHFVISLAALTICFPECRRTFSIGSDQETIGDTLSVMSYNVQLFETFAPLKKNQTVELIVNANPDIICIQEYGYSNNKEHLTKENLKKAFGRYPYSYFKTNKLSWAQVGVCILSKYPIINQEVINIDSEINGVIYADILFKGDTIRVFNCHLESNRITEEEKETLQKIKKVSKEDANHVVNSVSNKLSVSYKKRAAQADMVHEVIQKTHYPIILCGDFNDVPVSYAYHTIRGNNLADAFEECAKGYGYTYNKKLFHFRIDQIMHSKEGKAVQFEVGDKDYSDHYPISCKIVF